VAVPARRRRRWQILPTLACVLALLVAGCDRRTAAELVEVPVGGEIALTAPGGATFQLADHAGEVKLVFFGFATCPAACPATLLRLSKALQQLDAAQTAKVLVVFVSVDPARDTPESASEYVRSFGLRGIGVTGSAERLQAVAKDYATAFRPSGDPSNPVEHGLTVYLLDRSGKTRRLIHPTDTPADIARWIAHLLAERS
jgi:protein SCO1/2